MIHPFLTRIAQGPLLADGAMGTMLYARGIAFEVIDLANLDAPDAVRTIHEAYLDAGADVIETNTYGANRFKLAEHGLEGKVADVNRAGVELARAARTATGQPAFVAGSVGPLGRNLAPLGRLQPEEAREAFREQMAALVEAGVDLLILETFGNLAELSLAVRVARQVAPNLPLVAEMAFDREIQTVFGHGPQEVASALLELDVDVMGANCGTGPRQALRAATAMQALTTAPKYISAMPNAGWPERSGGRILYPATASYFAGFAASAVEAGVRLIGGCCGTTPDHIRAMRMALNSWHNGNRVPAQPIPAAPAESDHQPAPGPTALARALANGTFVMTVEMEPPRGADLSSVLAAAATLKDAGATVLNVSDNPLARMRMSPWAVASLIQNRVGIETVLHFPTRGRSLLRVQSDLLATHALGVRNIFAVMGDPSMVGDYPDALDSYDIVPTGLMRLIRHSFNQGKDYAGNSLGGSTNFLVGCALNLNADDLEREAKLLRKKIDHGAGFALTMPFYDAGVPRRFLEAYGGPIEIPVLAGVLPLYNERHASFLHNEVPGIEVPGRVLQRMADAEDKPAVGIQVAKEVIQAVRASVQGIYIMPPFKRYDIAAAVMRAVAMPVPVPPL